MKGNLGKWSKKYFGILLGMLGFASCINIGYGPDMYGQPYARYKVMGSVKSDSGNPIKNVRVVFRPEVKSPIFNDTTYTDDKGAFAIPNVKYDWPGLKNAVLIFEDIDGEENGGSFEPVTLSEGQFSVTQTGKGEGAWDSGSFTVEADVRMKKK